MNPIFDAAVADQLLRDPRADAERYRCRAAKQAERDGTPMGFLRRLLAVVLAVLVVSGLAIGPRLGPAAPAVAQDDTSEVMTAISITLDAVDFAFEGPREVQAGLVSVTMTNNGAEPHHAQLVKLNDGVTMEQFQEALQSGDPAALFPLAASVGGPGAVAPGDASQVILRLDAGAYVALCFIESADGVPHLAKGMVFPFTVTAEDGDEPDPTADAEVTMVDYTFEMPTTIAAGPQVWKVVNEGLEPHEFVIFKLGPGQTVEDFVAFFAPPSSPEADTEMASPHAEGEIAAPPFTEVGGMQALNSGLTGWAVLDLEPGEYVAVCFVPNAEGVPHIMLGMIQGLTVQ